MQTSGRVIEQTHAIEDVSDIGTLSGRDQVISWDVRRYLHRQSCWVVPISNDALEV
jgi:hypothetical protein